MAKKKHVKGEWKRLTVQAAAFLLQNPFLHRFFIGDIWKGKTKYACVPGLNCYSCPAAIGACPIGSLQASLSGGYKKPAFPFYVLGFLMLFGLTLGRWICGWLCPFGLIQDLVYRIPFFKKIRTFPYERFLRWLKYAVLGVLVIGLPLLSAFKGVLVPWFCKILCPAGTLLGGIPLVTADPSFRIGFLFWWKVGVLAALLLLSLLISRPFCRYLCPLGAIYGMFNRIALVHLDYASEKCVDCGKCETVCPMGIDPKAQFNSAECIRCGRCARSCPVDALQVRFGLRMKDDSHKKSTI
ncbi:MAG: 4Fe-4S binding protein [Clostridia bacterium]|nr:4Fe-4S binding protein [Clostridia bacterium]